MASTPSNFNNDRELLLVKFECTNETNCFLNCFMSNPETINYFSPEKRVNNSDNQIFSNSSKEIENLKRVFNKFDKRKDFHCTLLIAEKYSKTTIPGGFLGINSAKTKVMVTGKKKICYMGIEVKVFDQNAVVVILDPNESDDYCDIETDLEQRHRKDSSSFNENLQKRHHELAAFHNAKNLHMPYCPHVTIGYLKKDETLNQYELDLLSLFFRFPNLQFQFDHQILKIVKG